MKPPIIALSLLLSGSLSQAQDARLTLDDPAVLKQAGQISIRFYDHPQAQRPLDQGTWQAHEWRLNDNQLYLPELPAQATGNTLWAEVNIDGTPLERRVLVQAATGPGVTFASGNALNMDGNPITGLPATPTGADEAASKAYVDAQVGSVPGGDITSVQPADNSLNGGADTGPVTLGVNTTVIQSRVDGTCAAGSSIRVINADGSVTCEADNDTIAPPAWQLSGNTASTGDFIGTTNTEPVIIKVNGKQVTKIIDGSTTNAYHAPSIIMGAEFNEATAIGATVGGGGGLPYKTTCGDGTQSCVNRATGEYATVSGGWGNTASRANSTVCGGIGNRASADSSTVCGGSENQASGVGSTIGGGSDNQATNPNSTISGGNINKAFADYSSIGGGRGNNASADYSTIAGGFGNTIAGIHSSIGGGSSNEAWGSYAQIGGGSQNSAPASFTVVGGGELNAASGSHATVGGGKSNLATGANSTVPGGIYNRANGDNSLAAGYGARVRAADSGTFVWSDASSNNPFESTAANQFLIRASGGVGIGTNDPRSQFHVLGIHDSSTVARIENFSTNTSADTLHLFINKQDPAPNNDFIVFFGSNGTGGKSAVGAIEGDGAGGVTYKSGSADFAEYLPTELTDLQPGEVVALRQGKLWRDTGGAERLFVVSTAPLIAGNSDMQDNVGKVLVAFTGQVPVKVDGPVKAGDWLVASGQYDGRAIAMNSLAGGHFDQVVGQALENDVNGQVRALVGLPYLTLLGQLQRQNAALKTQITQMVQEQASWKLRTTQLERQQQNNHRLIARMEKLERQLMQIKAEAASIKVVNPAY